jgi:hypothetical protein
MQADWTNALGISGSEFLLFLSWLGIQLPEAIEAIRCRRCNSADAELNKAFKQALRILREVSAEAPTAC